MRTVVANLETVDPAGRVLRTAGDVRGVCTDPSRVAVLLPPVTPCVLADNGVGSAEPGSKRTLDR